jgi:hypothetical protein
VNLVVLRPGNNRLLHLIHIEASIVDLDMDSIVY